MKDSCGTPEDPLTGMKVINFLNLNPFARVRQIAAATKIPRTTVFDHLKGWGSTIRHLKWVPHHLTAAMMEQRVELSQKLLLTVRSVRHRGWTHVLTGDESWFWLTIDHEQPWLPPGAERPTGPRKMISSPKAMIIIFWSPLSFPVIQALPSKVTFTAGSFVENILPEIVAATPASDTHRRLVLHMEDASPHRALLTS
jgi:hypothetical protein